jgi:hypothetical protein
MKQYNLDGKAFVTTGNEKGLSSTETIFRYSQKNDLVTATYDGGLIKAGFVVGKQIGPDRLNLLFQCFTQNGELLAGQSEGTITEDENGHLALSFQWVWLNGDKSGGTSFYKQLT